MNRVLFISAWYPTDENPNFGVFIKEHARAISTTGCCLRVLAVVVLKGSEFLKITYQKELDESGILTYRIHIFSRYRDIFYHFLSFQKWLAYKYFKKSIAPEFSPDIIHSNVIFPAGIIGDYFSRKLKKKHVITEHWSKIENFIKKPILSKKVRMAYRNADLILPVSIFLRNGLINLFPELQEEKIIVVPNVISSDIFHHKPKQTDQTTLRFCAIATWMIKKQPDKYPELFIVALSAIQKNTNKKIELTMIGAGERVDELRQLCDQMNVKTKFTGYLKKEEIAEVLYRSDFFLHASRIETFGIVTIEAIMTGTPVVCSNVGALPEIVNDANGILCENNLQDWIAGINKTLSKDFDRKQMSDKVRDKYSYISIGSEIEKQYNRL